MFFIIISSLNFQKIHSSAYLIVETLYCIRNDSHISRYYEREIDAPFWGENVLIHKFGKD